MQKDWKETKGRGWAGAERRPVKQCNLVDTPAERRRRVGVAAQGQKIRFSLEGFEKKSHHSRYTVGRYRSHRR